MVHFSKPISCKGGMEHPAQPTQSDSLPQQQSQPQVSEYAPPHTPQPATASDMAPPTTPRSKKHKRNPAPQPGGVFAEQDLVFARFGSYPWWPGQVVPRDTPNTGKGGKTQVLVRFFGPRWEYGWIDNTVQRITKLTPEHISTGPPEKRHQAVLEVAYAQARSAIDGHFPDGWFSSTQEDQTPEADPETPTKVTPPSRGTSGSGRAMRLSVLQRLGLAPPTPALVHVTEEDPHWLQRWREEALGESLTAEQSVEE